MPTPLHDAPSLLSSALLRHFPDDSGDVDPPHVFPPRDRRRQHRGRHGHCRVFNSCFQLRGGEEG